MTDNAQWSSVVLPERESVPTAPHVVAWFCSSLPGLEALPRYLVMAVICISLIVDEVRCLLAIF